jgi:hypothetical protein
MAERKSSSSAGVTYGDEARRAGDVTGRSSSTATGGYSAGSGTAARSSGETERTGVVDQMKDRAAAQINSQKNRATDGIGTVAQAVRQSTQQLRDQRHETVARYVEQAADQVERFSQRLKQKDVGELVSDAQRLARRQPALFIGSAFALGLLGARFLKSSPPYEERHGGYGSYGAGGAGASQYAGGYPGTGTAGATDYQRSPVTSPPSSSLQGSSTHRASSADSYGSDTETR